MPDALAKTIPIWCCVISRILFRDERGKMELFTPENVVGMSEHAQINARIDSFVADAEVSQLQNFGSSDPMTKRLRLLGSSD